MAVDIVKNGIAAELTDPKIVRNGVVEDINYIYSCKGGADSLVWERESQYTIFCNRYTGVLFRGNANVVNSVIEVTCGMSCYNESYYLATYSGWARMTFALKVDCETGRVSVITNNTAYNGINGNRTDFDYYVGIQKYNGGINKESQMHKYTIDNVNGKLYIDDEYIGDFTPQTNATANLSCGPNNVYAVNDGSTKFKRMKMYRNGVLTEDYQVFPSEKGEIQTVTISGSTCYREIGSVRDVKNNVCAYVTGKSNPPMTSYSLKENINYK